MRNILANVPEEARLIHRIPNGVKGDDQTDPGEIDFNFKYHSKIHPTFEKKDLP